MDADALQTKIDFRTLPAGFDVPTSGYSAWMDPESLPDDVPIADAVEQLRDLTATDTDIEATATGPDTPPLEAEAPDWQEQNDPVEIDPESDEYGR